MKLLGKDVPSDLLNRIEQRLALRGISFTRATATATSSDGGRKRADAVEARIDPLSFNLAALEENADSTRGLPLHTHRGGAGRAVLLAKWAFRRTCQVFINETLSRQRVFNGHVRDSYAQLSAEVLQLRAEIDALKKKERPVTRTPAKGRKG